MKQIHAPESSSEAKALGFSVDSHVYPWVAYKGPRFQPETWHTIPTDKENYLTKKLEQIYNLALEIRKQVPKTVALETRRKISTVANLAFLCLGDTRQTK